MYCGMFYDGLVSLPWFNGRFHHLGVSRFVLVANVVKTGSIIAADTPA